MSKANQDKRDIKATNRKAKFEYHFINEFEAGLVLTGTEVKAIRKGLVNLKDAFCYFIKGELYVKSMYIGEYSHGNLNNHEPRRLRKLLLRKTELRKLQKKVKEKGNSLVPYQLYLTERGFVKLLFMLASGKKSYDKRDSIKDRDSKRQVDRAMKDRF